MSTQPETYFGPAGRANADELQLAYNKVRNHPVVHGFLKLLTGLTAVLNDKRQVLGLSNDFMSFLGIDDPGDVFGLRPGEMINCVHAEKGPDGCGTGILCRSCGAGRAIIEALDLDEPVTYDCSATVSSDKGELELFLNVRAVPITVEWKKFVLIFVQDNTREHQLIAMERTFFHDVSNLLQVLMMVSNNMEMDENISDREMIQQIGKVVNQITDELNMQKTLSYSKDNSFPVRRRPVKISEILLSLRAVFDSHPEGGGLTLRMPSCDAEDDFDIQTDPSIVLRVLTNMLTNAIEASEFGDQVRIKVEPMVGQVKFSIWNPAVIPADLQPRIFQRHYTTKPGIGHGLGTYSMRLFGEHALGGEVGFSSIEEMGTTFYFLVPDPMHAGHKKQ